MKTNLRSLPLLCLLFIPGLLVTFPAFGVGLSNKIDKTYALRAVYVRNQIRVYKVGMYKSVKILNDKGVLMPHGAMKSNSVGMILEKTIAVKPDGSAEMKVLQTGWKDATKGKVIAVRIPSLILDVDKRGVITKSVALQTVPNVTEILNAFMLYLPPGMALMPKNAVKIGDSWTVSVPNPYWQEGPVNLRNRLIGVERIGGVQTLRVSQYYSIPISYHFDRKGYYTEDAKLAVAAVKGTVSVNTVNYLQPSSMRLMKRDENVRWNMRFTGLNAVAQSHIAQKSVRVEASAALHSRLVKVEEPKTRRRKG